LIIQEVRQLTHNSLKVIREQLLMSKAELARKAGVSPLTIDRIENGKSCRMETMRKIILALGYTLTRFSPTLYELRAGRKPPRKAGSGPALNCQAFGGGNRAIVLIGPEILKL